MNRSKSQYTISDSIDRFECNSEMIQISYLIMIIS